MMFGDGQIYPKVKPRRTVDEDLWEKNTRGWVAVIGALGLEAVSLNASPCFAPHKLHDFEHMRKSLSVYLPIFKMDTITPILIIPQDGVKGLD